MPRDHGYPPSERCRSDFSKELEHFGDRQGRTRPRRELQGGGYPSSSAYSAETVRTLSRVNRKVGSAASRQSQNTWTAGARRARPGSRTPLGGSKSGPDRRTCSPCRSILMRLVAYTVRSGSPSRARERTPAVPGRRIDPVDQHDRRRRWVETGEVETPLRRSRRVGNKRHHPARSCLPWQPDHLGDELLVEFEAPDRLFGDRRLADATRPDEGDLVDLVPVQQPQEIGDSDSADQPLPSCRKGRDTLFAVRCPCLMSSGAGHFEYWCH